MAGFGFGLNRLRRPGEEDEEELLPVIEPAVPEQDTIAQLEALRPSYSRQKSFDSARQSDNEATFGSNLVSGIADSFRGQPIQAKPLVSGVDASKQRSALFDADEENDPTSPISMSAREMITKGTPDIAKNMGKHFARLSYAKAKQLLPFYEPHLRTLRGKLPASDKYSLKPETQEELAQSLIDQRRRGPAPKAPRIDKPVDPEVARGRKLTNDTKERKLAEAGKGGGGKMLPATEAATLGGLVTAQEELRKLHKAFKETSWAAGVTKFFPNTDARRYASKAAVAQQVIGKILEGGKLAEGDLARYREMMPLASDSDETAQTKVDTLVSMIEADRVGRITGLGQAGYNVSGFPGAPTSTTKGGDVDLGADTWNDEDERRLLELERKAGGQ